MYSYSSWITWTRTIIRRILVSASIAVCFCHRILCDKVYKEYLCRNIGGVRHISQYIASKEGWARKALVYVGNNTLTVLTWHFLCFKIVSLIIIQLYNLPIEQLACFPIIPEYASWWLIYFVVGAGVPLSILLLKLKVSSQDNNI